jgi:hypothetical protein
MSFPCDGSPAERAPEVSPPDPVDVALEEETLYAGPEETPRQVLPNAADTLATALAGAPEKTPIVAEEQRAAPLVKVPPCQPAQAPDTTHEAAKPADTASPEDPETAPDRRPSDMKQAGAISKSDVFRPDQTEEMYETFGRAFAASRVEPPKRETDEPVKPPLGSEVLAEIAQQQEEVEPDAAEARDQRIAGQLEDVRLTVKQMGRLPLVEVDAASRLLREDEWPDELRTQVESGGGDLPIGERLAARSPETGEPLVGDDALIVLLQWHNERFKGEVEKFEKEDKSEYLAQFASGTLRGVNEGWLPPVLLERINRFKEGTRIQVEDGVNLLAQKLHGEYSPEPDKMLLESPNARGFVHEALHACHATPGLEASRPPKIVGDWLLNTALREATINHMAAAILGLKDPFDTTPLPDQGYSKAGDLLDALCRSGKEPVDVRRFIETVITAEGEHGEQAGKKAFRQLRSAVDRAFPETYTLWKNGVGFTYLLSDDEPNRTIRRRFNVHRDRAREENFTFAA